jgi:type IV secretion system protein VirB3
MNREDTFQPVPIHRSLTRPQLIAGCDRELFISMTFFAILFTVPGGMMSKSFFNFFFGIGFFFAGTFFLARLAKKDSSMRKVFLRCTKYKSFYPARGTVTAVSHKKLDAKWV